MLKDRGIKKWQGLMMTEHIAMLRKMDNELTQEQPKSLSDWEYEDLQMTINQALQQNISINLTIWEGDRYKKYTGIIKAIDSNILNLEILNSVKSISFRNIHAAMLHEYFD